MRTDWLTYSLAVFAALCLAAAPGAFAFGEYDFLIPNGSVNSCDNCHGGDGSMYGDFGDNGNVWDDQLAMLDSDGDGFTNGDELLDPAGTWREGDPDPGDLSWVTNPDYASSHPPTGVRIEVPSTSLSQGDLFYADLTLNNADGAKTGVPLVFALEVGGQFWFWPSWSHYDGISGFDYQIQGTLPQGATKISGIPSFSWPDTGGASGSFQLYGAMLTPDLTALDGQLGSVAVAF
jgi:hypothetical protein